MNLQDAIYELLGIPIEEQPADCYRLLGVARFESNVEVISNAAARQMLFVRQIASGPHSQVSQDLLDLLAEAKRKLLNPERRRQYDAKLRRGSIEDLSGELRAAGAAADNNGDSSPTEPSIWIGEPASVSESNINGSVAGPIVNGNSVVAAPPVRRVSAPFAPDGAIGSSAGLEDSHQDKSVHLSSEVSRKWVVGADAQCDIVVRCPYVSRRHCCIYETEKGYWVEDLGSRNGTHVNHRRLTDRQMVTGKDLVTLGTLARMPWPPELLTTCSGRQEVRIVRIGRSTSNDVVLSDSSVSRRHAQLSMYADHTLLEDLGSTNGTFVGDSGIPINRSRVESTDVVRIGRFSMPVSHLLGAESVA